MIQTIKTFLNKLFDHHYNIKIKTLYGDELHFIVVSTYNVFRTFFLMIFF